MVVDSFAALLCGMREENLAVASSLGEEKSSWRFLFSFSGPWEGERGRTSFNTPSRGFLTRLGEIGVGG